MDITGEGGEISDIAHVLLAVEYRLVKVGNAPTERNVEIEEFGEFRRCLSRVGVAPRAERGEDFCLVVERHVAVHHCAHANGGEVFYLHAVLLLHVAPEVGVAVLHSAPYILNAVSPQSIHELVLPFVASLRYGGVAPVDEHRLNPRGTELDSEDGLALLYGFFRVVHVRFFCFVISKPYSSYLKALLSI